MVHVVKLRFMVCRRSLPDVDCGCMGARKRYGPPLARWTGVSVSAGDLFLASRFQKREFTDTEDPVEFERDLNLSFSFSNFKNAKSVNST
jgi:hypothetical protein